MSDQYISLPDIIKQHEHIQKQFNALISSISLYGDYDEKARTALLESLCTTVIQEYHFSEEEEASGIYDIINDYLKQIISYYKETKALDKMNDNITAMVKDKAPDTDKLLVIGIVLLFFFLIPGMIVLWMVEYKCLRKTSAEEITYYAKVANNFESHYSNFIKTAKSLKDNFGFEDKNQFSRTKTYYERLNDILVDIKMPKMIVVSE